MKTLNEILAKSVNYGCITLPDHTQHVAAATAVFAKGFYHSFDETIACKAALLHDLGKAHPHFQRKIQKINAASLAAERDWNYDHRHELSSLAFLPLFPKEEWSDLIDAVVAHHKSIKDDVRALGIVDLDDNCSDWLDNHLAYWEEWKGYGFEILKNAGLAVGSVTLIEARSALEYAAEYCRKKRTGWSPLRGLLKAADHFASAFGHDTQQQLLPLFERPDLSYYHSPARKHKLYPLSELSTEDARSHTLVVAPTGAGKIDFLLRRCKGRVFYTLPYQAF